MKKQLKRLVLLFIALLAAYLLSCLYLSQPVRIALFALVFVALAADSYRTLRQTAPVLRNPRRLPLLWGAHIAIALAMGAGYVGIQMLLGYDAHLYTGCQDFLDTGVMMACGMLLCNSMTAVSGTKAIQPQK